MSTSEDIMPAIQIILKQNKSLQQALSQLQQDTIHIREQYEFINEYIQSLKDENVTWSAETIAEKTQIPIQTIKSAMKNKTLPSIQVCKRGKGHIRVASPKDVFNWLQELAQKQSQKPISVQPSSIRIKPPNVVF